MPGYVLNDNGVCVDPFCLLYDEHVCINCIEYYGLDPTGKCSQLPDFCI